MKLDLYSERVVAAIRAAEAYAADLRQRHVQPAHLLVAMLTDRSGVVARVVQRLGGQPEALERRLHTELVKQPRDGQGRVEHDPTLVAALEAAERQARRDNETPARAWHVLIALADGPPDLARRALGEVGITRAALQYAARELQDVIRADVGGASPVGGATTPVPGAALTPPGAVPSPAPGATAARAARGREAEGSILERFGRDLTALARDGKLDPIVGRDAEIRRVMQVLGRRTKNNPILVGEPGVGKTAIVEGFAQRIAGGDVPGNLKDKRVVSIDMGALVAGTTLRGQFEERIRRLVDEVAASHGQVLVYIDEIHMLAGAGGSEGGGAADLLKPALARGEISLIGTTTPSEYRKHIESDKALERRFQEIAVEEPSEEACVAILRGIKQRFEIHHRVRILDGAVQAAVELSERYVLERKLPDKAVDLIDEAASRLRMQIDSQPTALYEVKRRLLNLEMEREALKRDTDPTARRALASVDGEIATIRTQTTAMEARWNAEKGALDRLTSMKAELEATQKLAEKAQAEGDLGRAAELRYGVVKELERAIERETQSIDALHGEGRMVREEVGAEDIAQVVADWTGIPTTRMLESERQKLLAFEERLGGRVIGQSPAVKAIAAAVRRSRAGLQDRNRPIGNFFFVGPTGVGKTELAKALAEFLFDSEEALIRIDMSEYMEQSKVNNLIGAAFGYVDSDRGGLLTEAVRKRPYSVVLFDEAEKAHPDVFNLLLQVLDEGRLTDSQGRRVDFTNTIIILTSNVGARRILDLTGKVTYEDLDREVHTILRDHFKPEFLNRLDDTVVFNALDRESMNRIFSILQKKLERMLAEQGLTIEFTPAAVERIVDIGFEPEFGARPLKRALLTLVQDPLSVKLLDGTFASGDRILADVATDDDSLTFVKA
jgi:ATP-dependent Clp protease ATP-binding subunit ClpB